jgi:hypothetical protein
MATTEILWDKTAATWLDQSLPFELNIRVALHASETLIPTATAISLKFHNHSSLGAKLNHVTFGIESTSTASDFTEAPTQVTFNGGDASISFSSSTFFWSDYVSFPWATGIDYLLAMHSTNLAGLSYISANATYGAYKLFSANETTILDVTGYTNVARLYLLTQIKGLVGEAESTVVSNLFFCHG